MNYFCKLIFAISTIALCMIKSNAQDILWVHHHNDKPYFTHVLAKNESIFELSTWYNVPLASIANLNDKKYKAGFKENDKITLPIDNSNYLPDTMPGAIPLYYKVDNNENVKIISRFMKMPPSFIQKCNELPKKPLHNGQIIKVGWIKRNQK